MEPEHREHELEDVAAERAAEATEESRRRRGAEDVRIDDDPLADDPLDPFADDGEGLDIA
jgi:hypothetical protein